jgi:hypothetical protein
MMKGTFYFLHHTSKFVIEIATVFLILGGKWGQSLDCSSSWDSHFIAVGLRLTIYEQFKVVHTPIYELIQRKIGIWLIMLDLV